MMQLIEIASDLKAFLIEHPKVTVSVHSIFDQAVNLISQEDVFMTLLSLKKDLSPMSMTIDFQRDFIKGLCNNDVIELTPEAMVHKRSKKSINIEEALVWPCEAYVGGLSLSKDEQVKNCLLLEAGLKKYGSDLGLLPLLSVLDQTRDFKGNTYTAFIEEVFLALIGFLKAQDDVELLALLPKFIGFGPGLTPSTDDFLSGVMVSLVYDGLVNKKNLPQVYALTKAVAKLSKGATTRVSEAMLFHAASGKTTKKAQALMHALYRHSGQDIESLATAIISNGASSGSDFLLGVLCMQRIILKIGWKEAYQ